MTRGEPIRPSGFWHLTAWSIPQVARIFILLNIWNSPPQNVPNRADHLWEAISALQCSYRFLVEPHRPQAPDSVIGHASAVKVRRLYTLRYYSATKTINKTSWTHPVQTNLVEVDTRLYAVDLPSWPCPRWLAWDTASPALRYSQESSRNQVVAPIFCRSSLAILRINLRGFSILALSLWNQPNPLISNLSWASLSHITHDAIAVGNMAEA